MLTGNNDGVAAQPPVRGRLEKALRIEWLGQTAASVFWITSVLTYGISSGGDWLQLFAASSWLLANVAALGSDDG